MEIALKSPIKVCFTFFFFVRPVFFIILFLLLVLQLQHDQIGANIPRQHTFLVYIKVVEGNIYE